MIPSSSTDIQSHPKTELHRQFESKIEDSEELKDLYGQFKVSLEAPLCSYNDVSLLFSKALKITQKTLKTKEINDLWIKLLKSETKVAGMIGGKHLQQYSFESIINLALCKKEHFDIHLEELYGDHADMKQVAEEFVGLALETLGNAPPKDYYANVLKLPTTLCLFAKHQEKIVGALVGGYVKIKKLPTKIRVLHINYVGRKADYPGINFFQLLSNENQRICQRFPKLDYISLCVNQPRLLQAYQELGFKNPEAVQGEEGKFFLSKQFSEKEALPIPTNKEVHDALEDSRSKCVISHFLGRLTA